MLLKSIITEKNALLIELGQTLPIPLFRWFIEDDRLVWLKSACVCVCPHVCRAQLMLAESFCAVNRDILIVKSRFASWHTSICQGPSLFSTLPGTFGCSHTHVHI